MKAIAVGDEDAAKLYVAGLSNEEFASKLRAIPFPFNSVDAGTSVEIYHGNHRAVETRSPVYTFVPYTIGGQQNLIAGYLCTPLVKFPVAGLKPGEDVLLSGYGGTTEAIKGIRDGSWFATVMLYPQKQAREMAASMGRLSLAVAGMGHARLRGTNVKDLILMEDLNLVQ